MGNQVLLVHGGHAGASAWDAVTAELLALGVTATAVDLPTRHPGGTLAEDVLCVRQTLAALEGPTVLVGHSYGGAVITGASSGNSNVSRLIYVAGALPGKGQSTVSALRDESQGPRVATDARGGWMPADLERARRVTYSDASDEQFAAALPWLGGFSTGALSEIPGGIGWLEHPTTYVICTQDEAFPIEAQRRFAANAELTVEIDAGHVPMLTRPAAVAAVIASAV